MFLIVAHHYVVSSGLTLADGPMNTDFPSAKSVFLWLFGIWGKTGINCFLMITGYFMCKKQITLKKFLQLLLEVYFYKIVIYIIFLLIGYEVMNALTITSVLLPIWGINENFTDCFLVFFLTIPFLNVLIQNMSQRQHLLLLALMLTVYSLLGSIPRFNLTFNYVTWFAIIYMIASFIRLYPMPLYERRRLWGWLTLVLCLLAAISVIVFQKFWGVGFYPVQDCNKVFPVVIAISSFLYFKSLHVKQSKWINTIAASTFGVLLIHANSNAMRMWLWRDTIDVVGHYSLPCGEFVLFSIGIVFTVFIVCNMIDQIRILTVEKYFFNWFDKKQN